MNIPDIIKKLGLAAGLEEQDPREKRLREIRRTINVNQAEKAYAEISRYIEDIIKSTHGRFEAICFVRLYTKDAIELSDKLAKRAGIPTEIGDILASKCNKMISEAITERGKGREEEFHSETEDGPSAAEICAKATILTDLEIEAMQQEAERLERQLEIASQIDDDMEDDEPKPAPKNWAN